MNIGCEACHGPGGKHVVSHRKADIYTFADKPKAEQTRVCGYCHIRLENELYHTAQNARPRTTSHPIVGMSYQPGDDWTKWYPDKAIIPGVHPEDKIDAEYKGDLAGMFKLDEQEEDGRLRCRQAPPAVPGIPAVEALQEQHRELLRLPLVARGQQADDHRGQHVQELPRRVSASRSTCRGRGRRRRACSSARTRS